MTSSSNSSQSTCPAGRVLWEEILVLSRFHSQLRADEWSFRPLPLNIVKQNYMVNFLITPLTITDFV